MASRALVLDANILVRAVLGKRVRQVIEAHAGTASFFVPEVAFHEAEEHLVMLVTEADFPDTAVVKTGVGRYQSRVNRHLIGKVEAQGEIEP